ncbi:hypothetical protein [Legionella hackeliae]|uniref:Substrate of the Dot/Icm secretion system n=1 Tax=Legionella hackeliae TaxID=449 RepID=A0A0A8UT86_LEGHA|nr:hypothetical protein [Legionella hackeliae]KTD10480.1 hypothetical protein Lhac_2848 [Legionella hackeliae]CEK09984.1 conserved protein of unknown function [Legionella hackeliae]STX49898.1 Uncharacterised protein [Legionella hackeliae]
MSTPEDKVKQDLNRLRELHSLKERDQKIQEEYQRLYDAYKDQIVKNPNLLKPEDKQNPQEYQIKTTKKGFAAEILKDYEKATGKKPVETDEGVALAFANQEEAVKFFKGQAKQNRAFDAYCAKEDHRVYSDGKGTFVHGTMADVTAYLKDPKGFKLDESGKLSAKEPESTHQSSPN